MEIDYRSASLVLSQSPRAIWQLFDRVLLFCRAIQIAKEFNGIEMIDHVRDLERAMVAMARQGTPYETLAVAYSGIVQRTGTIEGDELFEIGSDFAGAMIEVIIAQAACVEGAERAPSTEGRLVYLPEKGALHER